MPDTWFLPAPITLPGSRIDGTLGLRRVLRASHERVVPGIGGLRFVRQASWACAAIDLSQGLRQKASTNIRVANALEALACKLVFHSGGKVDGEEWKVRGVTRLGINHSEPSQWAYPHLREPKNYVSQPIRQSTTASLTEDLGLGFVKAGPMRFNAMELSERGSDLASAFLGQRASRAYLRTVLTQWLSAPSAQASGKTIMAARDALLNTLRPGVASDDECEVVRRCLAAPLNEKQADRMLGDRHRRTRLYEWIADLDPETDDITIDSLERRLTGERTAEADAHWLACQENFYLERFMQAARVVLAALIKAFQEGSHSRSLLALTASDEIRAACLQYHATGKAYRQFIDEHPTLRPASLPLDPAQSEARRIVELVAAQVPLLLRQEGDKLVAGILMRTPPSVEIDVKLLGQRAIHDGPWLPRRLVQLQELTSECAHA
jgi:hypothetical protein